MAANSSDVVKVVAIGAGVIALTGFCVWVIKGYDPVEKQLDRAVAELNRVFGRRWSPLGVAALQQGLRGTPAAPLVGLVSAIRAVEHEGQKRGWTGLDKRNAAVHYLKSAASLQRAAA